MPAHACCARTLELDALSADADADGHIGGQHHADKVSKVNGPTHRLRGSVVGEAMANEHIDALANEESDGADEFRPAMTVEADSCSATAIATIAGSARAHGSSNELQQLSAAAVGDGASGSAQCGATERQGGRACLRLRGGGGDASRERIFFPLEIVGGVGEINSHQQLEQLCASQETWPTQPMRLPGGIVVTGAQALEYLGVGMQPPGFGIFPLKPERMVPLPSHPLTTSRLHPDYIIRNLQ